MIDMCLLILAPAFYLQSISLLIFLTANKFTSFCLLEDQKMDNVNKKWRKCRNVDIENVINDSDTEVSIVDQWNTAIVDDKQHVLFPKNKFDITNVNGDDAVVVGESSDNEYFAKKDKKEEPVSKKVIERKKHFSNITKKKEISATN